MFRIGGGQLTDATPEFCSRIFSDQNKDYQTWTAELTAENIKLLQSMGNTFVENEEIVSALLSRALQHVFCRQFDAAMSDLNLWHETQRKEMKAQFAESIKKDYPEFATRLHETSPQK